MALLRTSNSGFPGNARPNIDMSVKARGFPDWMKRALLIEARAMMQFGLASQVQPEFGLAKLGVASTPRPGGLSHEHSATTPRTLKTE